jgi:DNA (cytosine-5)-methyltransferase 1
MSVPPVASARRRALGERIIAMEQQHQLGTPVGSQQGLECNAGAWYLSSDGREWFLKRQLNITGIFGGIGGFELGLARHGHSTSLFCEIDPEAAAVLSRRFPGVPISSDIRRTADLAAMVSSKSNLLTAGFPCADLSQAGLTAGFAGGRSNLIRDVVKVLKLRPFPHVLIENVPNWRHLHGGRYFAEVIDALERLGYRWVISPR